MNEVIDKLMFIGNENEELRMRSDVFLSLSHELIMERNIEHDMIRIDIDENRWVEVDTFYKMEEGFLLIIKRTFDKNNNQKWIVDDITDLQISRLVVDNEQIFI